MTEETFDKSWLTKLWQPGDETKKFAGGQITIIGGSQLFHGAPILALKAASRVVSMVYFSTPKIDEEVAVAMKSQLASFIWVGWDEVEKYILKSEAVLIGPGMMRNQKEEDGLVCDTQGMETRDLTIKLLSKFPQKQWVIDGGSLQVIKASDIPKGAIITPNEKEYKMLFSESDLVETARKYQIIILHKGALSRVADGMRMITIGGGNAGLIRGGTGDVLAGVIAGLAAKNEPLLAAAAGSYLVKQAAERLGKKYGLMFNADDVADEVRAVYGEAIPHPPR